MWLRSKDTGLESYTVIISEGPYDGTRSERCLWNLAKIKKVDGKWTSDSRINCSNNGMDDNDRCTGIKCLGQ